MKNGPTEEDMKKLLEQKERRRQVEFSGLKKGEKRELIVINSLLNRNLLQEDLRKMLSGKLNEDITKSKISNILGELEKSGIIERVAQRKKGIGGNPNLVFIPPNYHSLAKILEDIYSIKDTLYNIRLKRRFTRSKYGKKVINDELVLKIQSKIEYIFQKKYGDFKFAFSDEEKQIILKILQNSPSAIHYATQNPFEKLLTNLPFGTYSKLNIYENGPLYADYESFLKIIRKKFRKYFIFNLQIRLSEDLLKFGSSAPIEYTMSIKFLPKDKAKNFNIQLSQELENYTVMNRIKTRK